MSGVETEYVVDDQQVHAMLDGELERLDKVDVALLEAGEVVLEANKRQWGKGWKPILPDTIEREGSKEPEVKTGRLKRALTEPGAEGQVHEVAEHTLRLGVSRDLFYGRFQEGTKHQVKRKLQRGTNPTVKRAIQAKIAAKIMPGEDLRSNDRTHLV